MGIEIRALPGVPVIPLPVEVSLECDDARALFCLDVAVFTSPQGYVGCHTDAMKAGWLERAGPNGRMWLCPECSGK